MTEDLVQWNKVKGLERSKLDLLLGERRKIKDIIDTANESLTKVNSKILNALATADVKSVAVGETRVTLVPGGPTEKLDKKKLWTRLLELGVKEKVVSKAFKDSTKPGKEKESYVKVTEPGEKEEGAT
jgi:hypothetical protein